NFKTTVATPRKCPGRNLPSQGSASAPTSTYVENPGGYTSSTGGANTESTSTADNLARSSSKFRGYLEKSSCGANCLGLTKIETIVQSHSWMLRSTRLKCPACSAPIVGTRPTVLPARF